MIFIRAEFFIMFISVITPAMRFYKTKLQTLGKIIGKDNENMADLCG